MINTNSWLRALWSAVADLRKPTLAEHIFPLRLEMYTRGRTDLHASRGSTFIYAWWFFLSSSIVADGSYWHIFQVGLTILNLNKALRYDIMIFTIFNDKLWPSTIFKVQGLVRFKISLSPRTINFYPVTKALGIIGRLLKNSWSCLAFLCIAQ